MPGGPRPLDTGARAGKGSLWPTTHAGSSLSPRVLEAWARLAARGRVQRASITQFQQAGSRRLLWTHWAQWQAALLSMQLEPQAEARDAPKVDVRQWPRVASGGHVLALMHTPAPWKQVGQPRWGGRSKNDLRASGLRISLFQPMVASVAGRLSGGPICLWTLPLLGSRTASWLWKTATFGSISKHLLSTY